MPHVIRLRGPWDYEPLARFVTLADGRIVETKDDLPTSGVIELPADWGSALGAEFQGRVRFTRRFHRPTGLDSSSRVWLVIDDVNWQAEVTLNDCRLGEVFCSRMEEAMSATRTPARFDITWLMGTQNRLSIVVSYPGPNGLSGGMIGLVSLEIE